MFNRLNCFLSLSPSQYHSSAHTQEKHSHHHIISRSLSHMFLSFRQSMFFCLLGRFKAQRCSKHGLAWLLLSNGALMSAMLMRNYQKLIKIKKGPR